MENGSGTSASATRTVAVTGATGFVGGAIVRDALARGWRVRAMARDAEKARRTLPKTDGLEVVTTEISDADGLGGLLDGADACIHLIGIIREAEGGQTFKRVHVEATRRIVRACEAAGVARYVHMSALGASPEGPSKYQKTKYEAEKTVRASSLTWTIFRPGLIHGEGGAFYELLKGWCTGRSAPYAFMPYFTRFEIEGTPGPLNPPRIVAPTVAPVHVDDVAKVFCDAIVTPEAEGEVFPISGPELIRWPDMLRLARDTMPHGKPELRAVGIPGRIAALKARAAEAIGLGGLFPFDEGMALMGERDSWAPLDKARAMLGFDPVGFEESLKAYAGASPSPLVEVVGGRALGRGPGSRPV